MKWTINEAWNSVCSGSVKLKKRTWLYLQNKLGLLVNWDHTTFFHELHWNWEIVRSTCDKVLRTNEVLLSKVKRCSGKRYRYLKSANSHPVYLQKCLTSFFINEGLWAPKLKKFNGCIVLWNKKVNMLFALILSRKSSLDSYCSSL